MWCPLSATRSGTFLVQHFTHLRLRLDSTRTHYKRILSLNSYKKNEQDFFHHNNVVRDK